MDIPFSLDIHLFKIFSFLSFIIFLFSVYLAFIFSKVCYFWTVCMFVLCSLAFLKLGFRCTRRLELRILWPILFYVTL